MALNGGYDLIIAGGGLAGPAAAITAARAGARVLLLERGRLPRQKVCGEFVSPEAVQLLAALFAGDEQGERLLRSAVRVRRARLHAGGEQAQAAIKPEALSIARFDLDATLWNAAEEAGAECRQQVEVKSVVERGGGFAVQTDAGEFEARAVVNAAGRWSRLATERLAGAARVSWVGIKAHFSGDTDTDAVDLYFFDGGYCGVQPVRLAAGELRLNVCAMVRADVASVPEQVFARDRGLWRRSREWAQATETVTTAPLRFAAPVAVREGVLQAGDAAGFIDPFLGDGISLALRSGCMAAESLGAPRSYAERYQQELLPAFRRARQLRRGLRFPASALRLLRLPWVAEFTVRKTRVGG